MARRFSSAVSVTLAIGEENNENANEKKPPPIPLTSPALTLA